MTTRVIGVDPGPVPGIVVLDIWETAVIGRVEAIQCTHGAACELVEALLMDQVETSLVATERFVTRGRANKAQTITRDLVGQLQQAVRIQHHSYNGSPVHCLERNASQIKAWATDARLEAAGLLEVTKGMRHARDAARHALFAAVRDAGLPDPLSSSFTTSHRKA